MRLEAKAWASLVALSLCAQAPSADLQATANSLRRSIQALSPGHAAALTDFLLTHGTKTLQVERRGDCAKFFATELRTERDKTAFSRALADYNVTIKPETSCAASCCAFLPDTSAFSDTEHRLVRFCVDEHGLVRSLTFACALE